MDNIKGTYSKHAACTLAYLCCRNNYKLHVRIPPTFCILFYFVNFIPTSYKLLKEQQSAVQNEKL